MFQITNPSSSTMSPSGKRQNNVKRKSSADIKSDRIASAIKKLGGKEEADRILVEWEGHRRAEGTSDRFVFNFLIKVIKVSLICRRKREADGFMRGLILGHSLSREEASFLCKIGRCRYDRLRNLNPNQPIVARRPPDHRVTAEDKELVRLVMKSQSFEPGYPCSHRSTPLYMEDPSTTLSSIHKQYKSECEERGPGSCPSNPSERSSSTSSPHYILVRPRQIPAMPVLVWNCKFKILRLRQS